MSPVIVNSTTNTTHSKVRFPKSGAWAYWFNPKMIVKGLFSIMLTCNATISHRQQPVFAVVCAFERVHSISACWGDRPSQSDKRLAFYFHSIDVLKHAQHPYTDGNELTARIISPQIGSYSTEVREFRGHGLVISYTFAQVRPLCKTLMHLHVHNVLEFVDTALPSPV